MREVKFRARSKTGSNPWLYSTGYYYDGINYWFLLPSNDNKAIAWAAKVTISPETLGEYTGLKDKNEVEIYEGDVVKFTNIIPQRRSEPFIYTRTGVISFRSGKFINTYKTGYGPDTTSQLADDLAKWELIGNIYENPELIE